MSPAQPDKAPVDWAAVRARLAAPQSAARLSPERARAIMDERARNLARRPPEGPRDGETLELVEFTLGGERYAIEARWVREVVRFTDFARIPGTPAFLVGVTNFRGEILTVVDLRKLFDVVAAGLTDLSRVIVLGGDRADLGVLADAVHDVRRLPSADVLAPPESVTGVGREYLRGVTEKGWIVLDGAVLLADARLYLEQAEPDE